MKRKCTACNGKGKCTDGLVCDNCEGTGKVIDCKKCGTPVPDHMFDKDKNICNYCRYHEKKLEDGQKNSEEEQTLKEIEEDIEERGKENVRR